MQPNVLKIIWNIAQSLYQFLNINDLILHINQQIKTSLRAEAISVILYDEIQDDLVFCWAESDPDGVAARLKKIHMPKNKGIAGSVFISEQAEIIADVPSDSRHYKSIDKTIGFDTQSMIVVPLRKKRKTIGVLEVLNRKAGSFDQSDLTFLSTLAPIIAMALDNARMYGELDDEFKQLQAINKEQEDRIHKAEKEKLRLQRELECHHCFSEIVGNSPTMNRVLQLCQQVVEWDITVLITGETGTGKELIARGIHYNSPRKDRPFVAQNVGGIPETLLTSELFGHKKGAFTGAVADRKGLFQDAHGGTLLLDEVGEMSPAMQTALLRVLENGKIRPVGSNQDIEVDTRLISATNRDLDQEVAAGRFREDLLYRLNAFTINLPPLRERTGDIPILARHFIQKYNQKMKKSIDGLSPDALRALEHYHFPGNVRELENEIERAMALAHMDGVIECSHLSDKITRHDPVCLANDKLPGTLKEMVHQLEKSVLIQLIRQHGGNRTKIAKSLGLSRYGLIKKMQRYGL